MNDWFLLQLPCGGLTVGFPVDLVWSGLRALRIIADFLRRGHGKNIPTAKTLLDEKNKCFFSISTCLFYENKFLVALSVKIFVLEIIKSSSECFLLYFIT